MNPVSTAPFADTNCTHLFKFRHSRQPGGLQSGFQNLRQGKQALLYLCNRSNGVADGTTSVPKSVLGLRLDKVQTTATQSLSGLVPQ